MPCGWSGTGTIFQEVVWHWGRFAEESVMCFLGATRGTQAQKPSSATLDCSVSHCHLRMASTPLGRACAALRDKEAQCGNTGSGVAAISEFCPSKVRALSIKVLAEERVGLCLRDDSDSGATLQLLLISKDAKTSFKLPFMVL